MLFQRDFNAFLYFQIDGTVGLEVDFGKLSDKEKDELRKWIKEKIGQKQAPQGICSLLRQCFRRQEKHDQKQEKKRRRMTNLRTQWGVYELPDLLWLGGS